MTKNDVKTEQSKGKLVCILEYLLCLLCK